MNALENKFARLYERLYFITYQTALYIFIKWIQGHVNNLEVKEV
jgi:hypothetical protein